MIIMKIKKDLEILNKEVLELEKTISDKTENEANEDDSLNISF